MYNKKQEPMSIFPCSIQKMLGHKNTADIIALFNFNYYTSKYQDTTSIKCTTSFAMKGLSLSRDRVRKAKASLIELGFIKEKQARKEDGSFGERYILLYLRESNDRTTDFVPDGNTTTNALSNKENALSNKEKEKSNNINIITKKESQKQVFGEFKNIHMTEESLNKLCMQYGKHDVMDMIERVSAWKKAKGKRYKDDYAGILNWIKKDDRMVTFKNRVDEMFDGILKGVKDKQFDLTRVNQMINDFRSEHFKEAEVLIQRLRQNKTMLKLKEGTL